MSKHYSVFRLFAMAIILSSSVPLLGQSLACNGGVNISMDQNCEVVLSSKQILEGPDAKLDPDKFILSIRNHDGSIPSEILVYDPVNHEYSDTLGNEGRFIKFITPGNYIVTVKRILDGTTCWSELRIEDKLPPFTRDCPCRADDLTPDDECIFSCAAVNLIFENDVVTGNAGINPVFFDNCNNTGEITFVDILTPDSLCGNWIITRTWRSLVPDIHGIDVNRDLNCVQKFIFKKEGVATIMPPSKKVIVTCGVNTDPESLREYFSDSSIFSNPHPDTAIVRSYPSIPLTMPSYGTSLRIIGEGLGKPGTNDALCKLTASYTDTQIIPYCEDIGYKFVRSWYVIDWCTNETLEPFTQIIKVMDTIPPHFIINDTIPTISTDPWLCDSDVMVPPPDTMYDNCAAINQLTWIAYIEVGGLRFEANASNNYKLDGLGPGTYTVHYVVTDICNNFSHKTAVLVIKDLVKPVALSKRTVKVTFSSYLGNCVAKVFPYNLDAGSFDACDDELDFVIRRFGSTTYGPYVKFNDLDIDDVTPGGTPFGEVIIEMKVTDDCGNYNLAWTTVVLEDKNTDVTKICGLKNIDLDCTDDIDTAIVQNIPRVILIGCTNRDLPVDYNIRSRDIHDLCNTGRVVVDYFIEGSRDTICTKTFTLGDSGTLSIDWPDAVITRTCDDTDYGDVIISGGLCTQALPTEKFRDISLQPGSPYCKKILREITVIDWCNYIPNQGDTTGVYRFTQTIKIVDNIKPIIRCENLDADGGVSCGVANLVVTASGTDVGICAEELDWQAAVDTDDDGTYELELTVVSTGDSTVSATIDSFLYAGVHNVRWRASDGCGNSEEVFCTITITDDIAPSPQCISTISTATMSTDGSVNIWAADFDPMSNSTDACGDNLTYSFSGDDINVPSMGFTCDDIPDGESVILDLKVYVWDESGNRDFCNVKLRIDDNTGACVDSNSTASVLISGMITTSQGQRLESAEVNTTSMNTNLSNYKMTSTEGLYAFTDNVMSSDYEIQVNKNDDYLNGVSTLDMLLIQRHILGHSRFDNPYHVIAADVNQDERVSAIDLVVLRSLILGRTETLPGDISWKFVDASQRFEDVGAPWPIQESRYLSDLRSNADNQDFIAIKLGDISGNAIANSLIADNRSAQEIMSLKVENQEIRKGQLVSVEIDLNVVAEAYGVQLDMHLINGRWFNAQSESIQLSDQNVNISNDNLTMSWASLDPIEKSSKVIFSFEAEASGLLSEFLSIENESSINSEIYYGDNLETATLQLVYNDPIETALKLYQNVPNPYSGVTTIGFSIAKAGQVEFAIFDMTGRQLFAASGYYKAGHNELIVDRSVVNQKGVLYYQVSHNNKVATRKMISMD